MLKSKKTIFFIPALLFVVLIISAQFLLTQAHAAFNPQINYQGRLTDSLNQTVLDGAYNMEFRLYADQSTTTPFWTETRTGGNAVTITNGLFNVMLGEVNSLANFDFNQSLYLSINIGGTSTTPVWDGEMSPRKKIGAVPVAFEADKLDG